MPVLSNLPYTSKKEIPFSYFSTADQGVRRLSEKKAITAAGDHGAINAWYGNDSLWHGVICRHGCHTAEVEGPTKKSLHGWLRRALIKIGKNDDTLVRCGILGCGRNFLESELRTYRLGAMPLPCCPDCWISMGLPEHVFDKALIPDL